MSAIEYGAIDSDVHVEPPSMDTLLDYLDPYWHEYIWGGRIGIGHGLYPPAETLSARSEARAAGSFPPRSYEALRSELLDPYRPRAVVLTCVASFQAGRNPYYETAITRAINGWMRTEFLDSETPWGNVRYRAIHDAVARNNIPIALHAWGGVGMAPTTTGGASSYYEDYLYNSQIIAPAQMLSLVAEGVFERHPSIRVVLSELGFGWIPSLMWRYDKDWKALWRETPWVHERPSAYIKRHFRATTSPTQIPRRVTALEVEQFVGMLGAGEFLMYASDYPHDHGEDGSEKLLAALGTEGREAVLRGNAATLYGIGTSTEVSGLDGEEH